jgi:hypothetical protein
MAFWKRRGGSSESQQAPSVSGSSPTTDWKKVTEASQEIIDFLVNAYRDSRGTHSETVIGAAAALAGAYAQQSVQPMAPGTQYVISDRVSDLMFNDTVIGQSLVGIILRSAEGAGVARAQLPDPQAINSRVIAAFGSKSFPPLSVPRANYPHEWSPNASVRHRARVDAILDARQLNPLEGAVALTTATAGLIKLTATAIDPRIATTLALEIMIGVSKMRPLAAAVG